MMSQTSRYVHSHLRSVIYLSALTFVRQVACDEALGYPLNEAVDFRYTGYGLGRCELAGPPGVLATVRYVPSDTVRRIPEPSGVMIPTSSYTIGGQTCSLTAGAEMYVDDVQPPKELNVTDVSAYSMAFEGWTKSTSLSYLKVLQSSNPEGSANCGPPPGRGGRILIRNILHFEVFKDRDLVSPNGMLTIRLYPGARYLSLYISFVDEVDGLSICMFRTPTSGSSGGPSAPSESADAAAQEKSVGLDRTGILAIAGALLVCVAVIGLVFALRRRIWDGPSDPSTVVDRYDDSNDLPVS